jgi:hypothetical protein
LEISSHRVVGLDGLPDQREMPPRGLRTRDIYIPDLHIDSIKVKARDFRQGTATSGEET